MPAKLSAFVDDPGRTGAGLVPYTKTAAVMKTVVVAADR